jgi:hypothetical protein
MDTWVDAEERVTLDKWVIGIVMVEELFQDWIQRILLSSVIPLLHRQDQVATIPITIDTKPVVVAVPDSL